MVMAGRPGVQVASAPIAAVDVVGLGGAFAAALVRATLRAPWRGPQGPLRNVAVASTRELIRSLMGYMTSLPIDEFRALERVLDDISRLVLPPFVKAQQVQMESGCVGDVPGLWFRPEHDSSQGTIVYLHGGGYIGTSPGMYALFMAHLSRVTHCEVFAADYRLAPEFPYPAATDDIVDVLCDLQSTGKPLFIAGDSGGGGLAGSVLNACAVRGIPLPAAAILFSPEVSLVLDEPSITENAALDVLPWNVPTSPYLHGFDPNDPAVSMLHQDIGAWPPTFLVYGSDEIMRDSIRAFAELLEKTGGLHESHEVPDMFHVFPFLLPWAHESREVYRQVGAFVASVIERA
ncbi:alpha/beta hydrolase fold domain-containing protein [Jatrophihabitans sp.]|uniref:alpha/beta hydrolase fold domain-containing protein n=1 Tax=Jatrophihabitans sp. TaxID=1932789 RepID=UPI0030C6E626|nr:Alpha/beta hydrolase [Jatrophihabitans sp.]